MKRHDGAWLVLGAILFGVAIAAEGCSYAFVIEPRENGAGGSGGTAGSTGSGGTAGAGGGTPACVCEPDGSECTVDQCNSEGVCLHVPVARGTSCNVSDVCDENGECKECLNCTADSCPLRCPGIACENSDQCSQGYPCEDGVCCNDACEGPCKVCNRVGSIGTCTNLPVGLQVEGCDNLNACDGNGGCKALNTQLPLGALCGDPGQVCMTGSECKFRSCRTVNGGSCTDHLECRSNFCNPLTHKCSGCGANMPCPEGSACNTSTGTCKSWLGNPCQSDTDCVAGICSNYLCALSLGATCETTSQCATYNCVNGKCEPCTTNSDCVAGTTCVTNAYCKIAPGEICAKQETCQSGTCSGFPRVCD